jgi:hypothetical protein
MNVLASISKHPWAAGALGAWVLLIVAVVLGS